VKVLVTGSAGIVGRPVCEELMRRGHAVRGFDRAPSADLREAIVADIQDRAAVREAFRGMEAVVHLAAQPVDAPFSDVVGPNVIGLFNVLDAAREQRVRRVVLTSSIMVVGGRRERDRPCGVEEANPRNHYALSKLYAEQMGAMYARVDGMSVIAVRLGWVVRNLDEARLMLKLSVPDLYISRRDAGRFYAAALAVPDVSFAVVYATGRGGERVYDMEPSRRLLGFEPQERWPEGLPFPLPEP
jgi:uronate dehydrogenase